MLRNRDVLALLAILILVRSAWNNGTESMSAAVDLAFFFPSDAAFYTEGESSSTASTSSSPLSPSFSDEQSYLLRTTLPVRRSVSFSPGAEVHFGAVIHIDDYSEAEKYECWYRADEMREIRREVKETVALMNRNVPIHEINQVVTKGTFSPDNSATSWVFILD